MPAFFAEVFVKQYSVQIRAALDDDERALRKKAVAALGIDKAEVERVEVLRKSIDARRAMVQFSYTMIVTVEDHVRVCRNATEYIEPVLLPPCPGNQKLRGKAVVVGAGPCGLFAALELAKYGYQPLILERGQDIHARTQQVDSFFAGGTHDEENNVLFGDGGAGTFSDGKLTSRSKDARTLLVLREFVKAGAPADILIQAKPHVGTDVLKGVIQSLKERIISLGGVFLNGAKLNDFRTKDGSLTTVGFCCQGKQEWVDCNALVLAIGHSARDTYQLCREKGIQMIFKPFAVGVRIEHPQAYLNQRQYGPFYGHPKLGAAEYALTARYQDRGVYTFCMCPGGMVIPSVSESGMLCVNGMSMHARDGQNGNAAVVVQVRQEDCGNDCFAGIALQRRMEQSAYAYHKGYVAPAQRVEDFLAKRTTKAWGDILPSYPRGTAFADLNTILPDFVAQGVQAGVRAFDRKMHGYAMPDAVLTAPETRTSAPVRILRDTEMQASIRGIFPAGEGAGYAGGIVSAAADGISAAHRLIETFATK